MPIKVCKDIAKVERARAGRFRDHLAQGVAQRPGPVSQQRGCTTADRDGAREIRGTEWPLPASENAPVIDGTDEDDEPQQRPEFQFEQLRRKAKISDIGRRREE
jgi:hypothetical protein